MIELMITVVIVAVCLVLALRAFSISAATASKAYSSMLAVDILENKLSRFQERAILEDGVEPASLREDIATMNRKLTFTEEIAEWERPQEEELAEKEEKTAEIDIYQIDLEVNWKSAARTRALALKTLVPAKGFRHKF